MSLKEAVERARSFLRNRQTDYRLTFGGVQGQRVLADLARFCRAHRSTMHSDPRAHAVMEGRREVWLRIQSHLQLSDEQIWQLYGKGSE